MATITGTNFQPGAAVTFGGQPASNVVWVSSTTLTCKPPPHAAGVVDVVVTNPDGSSATGVGVYTYGASWDPSMLTSLVSWYKGNALQTDLKGSNNYSVVGAPTHGTQNGKTTEIFNGSSDRLSLATLTLGGSGAMAVFMAAKVISSDATRREFFEYDGICLAAKNGKGCILDGAELVGTTTIAGLWKRLGMTVDGAALQKLYVNGAVDASQTGAIGPPTSADSQIANYFNFCNIEIGEILVCNAIPSSTDLTNIDNYLSSQWAI